jgi:predicted esterase
MSMLANDHEATRGWPRARRAAALCLVLAGAGLISAGARADLIILKDGFLIHGRIKHDMVNFVDPVSGRTFTTAKLNGFYMIDDDARRIVFSASQVADATRQDINRAADVIRQERITRYQGGKPMPLFWDVDNVDTDFRVWERDIRLNIKNQKGEIGGRYKFRQRITELTPHHLRLEALYYNWTAYYLTREFDPETISTLIIDHLERLGRNQPKLAVPKVDQHFHLFRFLLQAGWYAAAEKKLKDIENGYPKEKERIAAARKILHRLQALRLFDDIERAAKAGQHKLARSLLAQFGKEQIDPDEIGDRRLNTILAVRQRYQHTDRDLKRALHFLEDLPQRVNHVSRGPVFREAAEVIKAGLHPDTLPRLEGFIGMAEQAERNRKNGRRVNHSPEELLALAVSGWLLGNDGADSQVEIALNLWEARRFILKYQTTTAALARRNLRQEYSQRPSVAPDEMAQMIRFLPPPEAEKKLPQGPQEFKVNLSDVQRRNMVYRIQLPPEYHHNRTYPVLFVLHGARETAKDQMQRWSEPAAQHGYILVAPEWSEGSDPVYRYSAEEHAAVIDVLRDLRRRFQVDSDRVFLFGFGEGGIMAFDVGLAHPDLFAGVLPMAAPPRYFAIKYWPNAQYLPFYVVDGAYDGKGPEYNRAQFKDWVRSHYPCLYVEYKGRGPEWFAGELPHMFDWMAPKKRTNPWYNLGDKEGFCTMRPTDNRFYWLSTDAVRPGCFNEAGQSWKSTRRPASLSASIASANTVFVHTLGVDDVTVWFGPGMLDFEKPVAFRINGKFARKELLPPSLEVLLEDLYQRGDRHRLYLGKQRFTLRK